MTACFLSLAFTVKHSLRYSGIASDLSSGEFYYTEEHEEWNDDNGLSQTTITFKDKKGDVIVTKRIDYTKNSIQPDFMQEDLRDGYEEGAETKGQCIEMKCRKNFKKKLETKLVCVPSPAVVDAGFNNFVKAHLDELQKGKVVKFNFAVPSQLDYFSFRMYKSTEEIFKGKKAIVLRMEPEQFILRSLVPPAILTYTISSKRLMQYEGLSTINDKKGKSYRVKISYPLIGP